MRSAVSLALTIGIVFLLFATGCADVKVTQKVGDFGTTFGASSEEQKAIDWFKATYGDPTTNNDKPARFIEPLITSGISDKNLPMDKVTTFPVNGGSVYFFVIYDNFKKGDPISVNWTYLENGREVTSVQQQAGGDFGRFIVEFQKPDSGWGTGKQRITITGDGTTANVEFSIGDALQTTPLPYNPAGQGAVENVTGNATGTVTLPTTTLTTTITGAQAVVVTTTVSVKECIVKGGTICEGKCVNLKTDPANCGQCGVDVGKLPHGSGQCRSGIVVLNHCDRHIGETYMDCNQVATDGCEINILFDTKNCGDCGKTCPLKQYCNLGKCYAMKT